MKSKLARLGTLSSEEKTVIFDPEVDPIKELAKDVKLLTWATTAFAIIVAIILTTATIIVARQFSQEVQQNENLVIALCRQNNAHNRDLTVVALDLGVPAHVLAPFQPKPCTTANLRREFVR